MLVMLLIDLNLKDPTAYVPDMLSRIPKEVSSFGVNSFSYPGESCFPLSSLKCALSPNRFSNLKQDIFLDFPVNIENCSPYDSLHKDKC